MNMTALGAVLTLFALLLALVLFLLAKERKAGRQGAEAEIAARTLEIKHAQQKAAAAAPRTKSELIDELRKGEF
jgi:hypothetical protein